MRVMAKSAEEMALPGLESMIQPLNARPGDVDMTDGKVFTAEVLFRDHPNVFKSACQLLFKHRLSDRSVASALMLSHHTVRAIRDMVVQSQGSASDAAAAAFFIKSRVANSRRVVELRALEALSDRLANGSADDLSTDELLRIVAAVNKIDEDSSSVGKSSQFSSTDIIDVDVFDAALDGLNGAEKSAREDGPADVEKPGDHCSTTSKK